MNTIWIYGDSFAEPTEWSWTTLLSDKLGYRMDNKAVGGSCTEYSFQLFLDDYKSDKFLDNDIIIFVTSTPGRLFLKYHLETDPTSGSRHLQDPTDKTLDSWYYDNKHHIQWLIASMSGKLNSYNHEAYVSMVKDIAINTPNAKFLVLGNSNSHANFISRFYPSNFLRSYVYIGEISGSEVYGDKTEFLRRLDPRINHLTLPNNVIFSECVFKILETNDVSHLDYYKFQTDVITNIETEDQYRNLVDKGLLPYQNWWLSEVIVKRRFIWF